MTQQTLREKIKNLLTNLVYYVDSEYGNEAKEKGVEEYTEYILQQVIEWVDSKKPVEFKFRSVPPEVQESFDIRRQAKEEVFNDLILQLKEEMEI